MVRIAVISDVHANVPALRAVLAEIESAEPDALVSCGDLLAGPLPGQTIELLRGLSIPVHCVRGNGDRAMAEVFDGAGDPATAHEDDLSTWAGRHLTREERSYLSTFCATLTLEADGLGPVLFCHGSPRRDDEVILRTSSSQHVAAALADVDEHTVICGHTHMQFDFRTDRHRLVNVGSVGMAYGQPGAYWAMLGPGVSLRRTSYDRQAAAREIREVSQSPRADFFATQYVLQPPTAEEALAVFQQLEGQAGI